MEGKTKTKEVKNEISKDGINKEREGDIDRIRMREDGRGGERESWCLKYEQRREDCIRLGEKECN